mmetsp:Transcript_27869/g.30975  ORF Transcript_27869/g.30975 Transcript_27869/m.30975 type:complete len:184 (+) Transcript_27869:1-552(+)
MRTTTMSRGRSNVMTLRAWTAYLKVFAGLMILGGVVVVATTFIRGLTNWYQVAAGVIYILTGLFGLVAAFLPRVRVAQAYFGVLIASALAGTILMSLAIVNAGPDVTDYCISHSLSDADCKDMRMICWLLSICGLLATVVFCCCCNFCTYSFTTIVQNNVTYDPEVHSLASERAKMLSTNEEL